VLVQREMESGRSPLVSIARALAGTRKQGNWFQKKIMVATGGAAGAPDTEIVALRPRGGLGLTAEAYTRSERPTGQEKKKREFRRAAYAVG